MRPDPIKMTDQQRAVLSYDVNTIAKMLAEQFPSSWKRMYTRSVDAPGNYYSSKSLAVGLTGAIEEGRAQCLRGEPHLDSNVGFIAGELEKYDFPTYYVSSPLIAALKQSRPPEGLHWADITFPFPAICFMLPRGSLVEPEGVGGNDIILVGACKMPANKRMHVPTVGATESIPEDRISTFWLVAPSALISNDTTFPASHPLEPITEWIDAKTNESGRPYIGPATSFSVRVAALVSNFILLMESRKELIEPGKRLMKAHQIGKVDLHSPTWLGRNYTILHKYPPGDPKGHFTELGWRAGHFKRQHFGQKNEQTKTIFIEPYIAFTRALKAVEEEKELETK